MTRASTTVSRIIKAPRSAVYKACLDADTLAKWRVPNNMSARVHVFEAREGGTYRMSLIYLDPQQSPGGKTSEDTDTFQGRFVELVPDEKIVEAIEFESHDPGFAGQMKMTTHLADAEDGTDVMILCENLPAGIRPEDNETGTRQSLQKLAALLETG
ncbi:MAG TPA: SRPBCC family protein [Reyranella sp.]|nr:SRPBCC family protein [Reyranella sp.]